MSWDSGEAVRRGVLEAIRRLENERLAAQEREDDRSAGSLAELFDQPVIVHVEGVIRFANRAAAQLLGVEFGSELRGRSLEEVLPAELADILPDADGPTCGAITVATVAFDDDMVRNVHVRSEKTRWAELDATAAVFTIVDDDGAVEPVGSSETAEPTADDPFGRLEDPEPQIRPDAFVGQLTFPVFASDLDGTIVYANAAFEDFVGTKPVVAADATLRDFLDPDAAASVEALANEVMESGEPSRRDITVRDAAGAVHEIDAQLVPLLDSSGTLAGLQAIWVERAAPAAIADLPPAPEPVRDSEVSAPDLIGIAEHLDEALIVRDIVSGDIIYANPAFDRLWGNERPSDRSDHGAMLEAVHPDDRERVARAFMSGGSDAADEEYRLLGPTGATRVVRNRNYPVAGADGSVRWRVGLMEDVTERRAETERLREQEGRLATITGNLPGAVFQVVQDIDGHIDCSFASDRIIELFGVSAADVMAAPSAFLEAVTFVDRECVEEIFVKAAEHLQQIDTVTEVRVAGKGEMWIRLVARPSRNDDGSVTWDGHCLDATKLRKAELELIRKEALYRELIEAMPYAVLIEKNGTFIFANTAASRLLGADSSAVLIGMSQSDFEVSGFDDGVGARFDPTGIGEELKRRRLDGSEFWTQVATVSIDWNGESANLTVLRDITQKREVQNRMHEARTAAESANAAKSEFLATMSHEIRTPLHGMLGMAGLLLQTELDEEQEQQVRIIRQSGDTLLAILNDILDYSKIQSGRLDLEDVAFDVRRLVQGVTELLAPQAYEKGLDAAAYVAPNVPRTINGDPGRLRQVLLNLVGNAVKFTREGAIALKVTVDDADDAEATIRFRVEDTGIGFPDDIKERLFERFTQADASTTRQFGGTGLGLAISRQLATRMGGEIGVEHRAGGGSLFWVTVRCRVADTVLEDEQVPLVLSGEVLAGRRILIANETPMTRRILEKQLRSLGADVALSGSGEEATAAMRDAVERRQPIDAVIVEEKLPDGSAIDLVRKLRSEPCFEATRFIVSAAAGFIGSKRRAELMGFDANLPKPIRVETLARRLVDIFSTEVNSAAARDAASEPVAESRQEGETMASLKILLVEDNKVNQKLAVALLRHSGHEVDLAENGIEAVNAARDRAFDLILMDIQMPEMDGMTATKLIRAFPGDSGRVPIIAMTANAMKGDREKCLAAGMDDYLSKPIDIAELNRTILRQCPEPRAAASPGAENAGAESADEADMSDEDRQDLRNILKSLDKIVGNGR